MMTFFHTRRAADGGVRRPLAGSPRGRLLRRRSRRALAAVCAACAVLCALQCVLSTVRVRPVLVAQRDIARGTVIAAGDVRVEPMPDHEALRGTMRAAADAVDGLAQLDIHAGDVLLPSMIGAQPTVPAGHTVIDVRLGDRQEPFPAGTSVTLASIVGCDGDAKGDGAPLCTISDKALVMGEAHDDETMGAQLTPVAMPAADALRALAAQEEAPIIVVRNGGAP